MTFPTLSKLLEEATMPTALSIAQAICDGEMDMEIDDESDPHVAVISDDSNDFHFNIRLTDDGKTLKVQTRSRSLGDDDHEMDETFKLSMKNLPAHVEEFLERAREVTGEWHDNHEDY